jgi:hypothetical protein
LVSNSMGERLSRCDEPDKVVVVVDVVRHLLPRGAPALHRLQPCNASSSFSSIAKDDSDTALCASCSRALHSKLVERGEVVIAAISTVAIGVMNAVWFYGLRAQRNPR